MPRSGGIPMGLDFDLSAYKRDGYATGLVVREPNEAEELRRAFDTLEAEVGRDRAMTGILDRHFDVPWLMDLAMDPKIVSLVEAVYGDGAKLLATHAFCKFGPDDRYVAWHQDLTYWGLEPPRALTVWYAIDRSDRENGCMSVIPGTHLAGKREHGKAERAGNLLSINQEVPVNEEEQAGAVDLILESGQASVHDGWLIHGSLPNRSTRRRCGITLRYVPAGVEQVQLASAHYRYRPLDLRATA